MNSLRKMALAAVLCLTMMLMSAVAFAQPAQAATGPYATATATASIGRDANAKPSVSIGATFMNPAAYGYDTQMNICGVYRSESKPGPGVSMPLVSGDINMRGKWTMSWDDTNLAYGKTYYYFVKGYRVDGSSTESGVLTVRTPPANVTGLSASLASASSISLSWSKSTGADGYYIYQADGSNDPTKSGQDTFSYTNWPTNPTYTVTNGSTTSLTVTGLNPDTPYFFNVKAYSKDGSQVGFSSNSNTVKLFTPPVATSVSTTLKTTTDLLMPYTKTTQTIRVSWKKTIKDWYYMAGETGGYVVQRSTDNKKWTKVKTVSNKVSYYDDSSIKTGKKYYYRVIPFVTNTNGVTTYAAASASKSIKSLPATGNVSKYKKLSNTKYRVYWKKSAGASGYMLWCYRTGGSWTKLKEVKASQTHINITGLKPGAQYHMAVVPFVKNGSTKTYGVAKKTWGLDRRAGKNKAFLTTLR